MTTVTVYDPPMCCSTGVCGPEVDPKLAQFAGDLDWLKGQGIEVRRFNLAQEPAAFVEHPEVKALLDRSGGDDLPAIVVGTKLAWHGGYPARAELAEAAGLARGRAQSESALVSEEVRELIALGAAIAASCEPCFKFHYDKARKLGVSAEAMREAVKIGEAVKAASAKNILGLADRMLGSAEPKAAASSCRGGSAKTQPAEAETKTCC
jgi:AhpD family alkylhydroperoxidase